MNISKNACMVCQTPKSQLKCGVCSGNLCKNCAEFLAEDAFSFLAQVPPALKHRIFCLSCFNENVVSPLNNYNETMAKAKEILIFTKSQAKETRFIKRDEPSLQIADCIDHDEVIMRLAFKAVELGFNAVIDIDILSEKKRMGSYQTHIFRGTGIPAFVTTDKLVKDRSLRNRPN